MAAILYDALRRDDGMHTSKSGSSPASPEEECMRQKRDRVQVGEILEVRGKAGR